MKIINKTLLAKLEKYIQFITFFYCDARMVKKTTPTILEIGEESFFLSSDEKDLSSNNSITVESMLLHPQQWFPTGVLPHPWVA
jgi:hypothetical protein